MQPLISICIPAYKRIDFLKRLLRSIQMQTFRDFEVVVTDDSPSGEVSELCNEYATQFPLHYFRNAQPLGTPDNWNEGLRRAKGQWIKLMHDDDWYTSSNSLQEFATAVQQHPDKYFFYSAYRNVYANSGKEEDVFVGKAARERLQKTPEILFSTNLIGPPSVILHRNDPTFRYDQKIKWVVDIDFYIRCLHKYEAVYIPQVLVNVGLHQEQVTVSTFRNPEVEVPENFYLLNKVGFKPLNNVRVYDAWWRLMRNLRIKDLDQIRKAGYHGDIPQPVQSMIRWQRRIPNGLLHIGVISKLCMMLNYIRNYPRL